MGDQLSTEDPLGYRTTSVYDTSRRVEASIDQLGYRTTYIRDAAGQVTGVLNARGYRTTSVYDAVGNVTESIDALGYRTTNTYDSLNRGVATQNARGYTWTTVYDAASQVTASVDPLGYRTTNTYTAGGLPATVTDPLGRVTTNTYDAAAPLLRSVTSPGGFVSTYGYDTSMRGNSQTAPGGGVTTTTYDTRGLMSQIVNPLGYRTSYGYDAAMQPVTLMNALGQVRTSTYDPNGRLEAHRYQQMPPVTYSYDARSQVILVQDQMGLTTSQYDPRGALTTTTSAAGMTTLAYDAVGSRNLEVLPGGQRFTYAYDAAQQMTTLSYGALSHLLAYNPVGDATTETYGNGSVLTRAYDPRGYLTTWVSSHEVPGGITIGFTYDAAGRKTVRTDAGVPTTYSYDNDDRLTGQVVAGRTATFAYDSDRNLTLKWHQGQSPVTMTNNVFGQVTTSIQGSTVTTYSWDAAGRNTDILTPTSNQTRTWDEENRLVNETRSESEVYDFVYGHDNLRGRTIFNSSTDRQFLWVDGELVMQFGSTYTSREPLVRADGMLVGTLSQAYYADDLGHIVQWLEDAGGTENVTYWPYGEIASGDVPTARFGYMGAHAVSSTPFPEVLYAQQRWLEAELGRFPSVDPLWPSELAYGYCNSEPTQHADFSGDRPVGQNPKKPERPVHITSYCTCAPFNVHGVKKGDARYKCFLNACKKYCLTFAKVVPMSANMCDSPNECIATNTVYPACTSGEYWAFCGQEIQDPLSKMFSKAVANQSNYPYPVNQVGTWARFVPFFGEMVYQSPIYDDFCCVECKMRACCKLLSSYDPIRMLVRRIHYCNQKYK